jgi:pyruvate kinase
LRAATRIPVMLDLKGPQLRVLCTTEREDPVTGRRIERPCRYPVEAGDLVWVGFGEGPVRFNHDVAHLLRRGDEVRFDNGAIRAVVADPGEQGIEPVARAVLLEIHDAGPGSFTPQMGANVPGRTLDLPSLTDRDLAMMDVGIARGVEAWALSFARGPADVAALHEALAARGDTGGALVPKIEEERGIANLEGIVGEARARGRDVAVMIARGDLFVELPFERLFAVQEDLVRRCAALGVPSIVATGLLLSMQERPIPARSEVCDVASALRCGAHALLLSDETSNGRHPVEAVETLASLIGEYGGPLRPEG